MTLDGTSSPSKTKVEMSKRNAVSDTSVESPDGGYNSSPDGKKGRFSNSQWSRTDIESQGVFYDKDPMSMIDFLDLLKEKRKFDLPNVVIPFIDLTKTCLAFSINEEQIKDQRVHGPVPPLEETILCEQLDGAQRALNESEEDHLQSLTTQPALDNELSKKLFKHWSTKMEDFLEDCKDMVKWLYHPDIFNSSANTSDNKEEEGGKRRDSIYWDLFISWCKVFFLRPKIGNRKQTEMVIRNKEVRCVSDVRFYAQANRGKIDPVLILSCEVRRTEVANPNTDEEPWIAATLDSDVMGQFGIQLIAESANSEFRPCVLGMVCMQTEVIFTFLDIKGNHAESILENKDTEGNQAHIHYTKAYDFLKADDREQILETFFWLGCLQKHNLYRYFLRNLFGST